LAVVGGRLGRRILTQVATIVTPDTILRWHRQLIARKRTYYTVFVIELHFRRVHIVGSTPHPDEAFLLQIARQLTDATDGVLKEQRFLVCDRDQKWSRAVRHLLETSGVRVIRTPFRAPNCNRRVIRSSPDEHPHRAATAPSRTSFLGCLCAAARPVALGRRESAGLAGAHGPRGRARPIAERRFCQIKIAAAMRTI